MVDDIDRLSSDEISHLFAAIRAVLDLPNVVYVLACDKSIVARVLSSVQGTSGDAYLEKIVQVSFEVPAPTDADMRGVVWGAMRRVVEQAPDDLRDMQRLEQHWEAGLSKIVRTYRDATRLANALSVTYGSHTGLNPVDFICIEALRVLCRPAYDGLRAGEFPQRGEPLVKDPKFRRDYATDDPKWVGLLEPEDRDGARALVALLFPKVRVHWGEYANLPRPNLGGHTGDEKVEYWPDHAFAKCRAWHREFSPIYLMLRDTGAVQVRDAEIQALRSLEESQEPMRELLRDKLDAGERVREARSRRAGTSSAVAGYFSRVVCHYGARCRIGELGLQALGNLLVDDPRWALGDAAEAISMFGYLAGQSAVDGSDLVRRLLAAPANAGPALLLASSLLPLGEGTLPPEQAPNLTACLDAACDAAVASGANTDLHCLGRSARWWSRAVSDRARAHVMSVTCGSTGALRAFGEGLWSGISRPDRDQKKLDGDLEGALRDELRLTGADLEALVNVFREDRSQCGQSLSRVAQRLRTELEGQSTDTSKA
jgi:hypothetical protein